MTANSKTIGNIKITAVSDGMLAITASDRVIGLTGPEVTARTGRSDNNIVFDVNAFLIKRDGGYDLVDAGCGNTAGPALGKQPGNLRALGVDPASIRHVFLTHFHPDHSNGLIDADGNAVYPNAQVFAHADEAKFWIDDDLPAGATEMMINGKRNTLRAMKAYPDRLTRVKDGEVMPGVAAVLAAGHTAGHTAWLFQSGGEGILIWGDIVHLAAIQIAEPDYAMTFDYNPDNARAARRRTFDRVAADKLFVAGAHLDFPGFGTIVRKGAGYAYEAM